MAGAEQAETTVADMTSAELDAWLARSRAAQGLPPKITNPAVIAQLVTLAFAGLDDHGDAA